MTDGLLTDEQLKASVPMQREGNIDDMAGIILFLANLKTSSKRKYGIDLYQV
ncbi:hypothetical protein PHLCEN_2v12121 [Hermanssonia centrifuga]|uniref:Uncharacterized protein n=1 Tax=Hermanssonia centrifuga TaxID=98765 RepID=A0A2R6NHZ6_9APHY|nr:hypothetical protein PHLCEN_2v12121 [Hermanssonia centrifuga]